MSYIQPTFISGNYYHLYNRGVAKQPLFKNEADYQQLLICFSFYLEKDTRDKLSVSRRNKSFDVSLNNKPDSPLIDIVSYCLMPNHFHLLVRQVEDGGISMFMRRSLNSYTRYFNTKYDRVGSMFQGTFRSVEISSDEQLLHVSRYIHLNPIVAKLCTSTKGYPWSSCKYFIQSSSVRICNPEILLELANGSANYQDFVEDYLAYAQDLAAIKDKLIDGE